MRTPKKSYVLEESSIHTFYNTIQLDPKWLGGWVHAHSFTS